MAVLSAGIATSRANITNVSLSSGDLNVMSCYLYPLQYVSAGNYLLDISGNQLTTGSGLLSGGITTDTPADPSLSLVHTINNDTLAIWSDYHVQVTMSQPFAFSNVLVSTSGWSVSAIGGPSPSGPNYVGTIDFLSGGPASYINPGGVLNFSFAINFAGSVAFSELLTPSTVTVPEPSAIALLACGLMGLFVIQRRLAA